MRVSRLLTKQERKSLEQELRLERNAHDSTDVVIEESASINAQSTIALLKKLEQKEQIPSTHLGVADNARYYRNRVVKAFLETSKVQIIFLPPYSPNLKPN